MSVLLDERFDIFIWYHMEHVLLRNMVQALYRKNFGYSIFYNIKLEFNGKT